MLSRAQLRICLAALVLGAALLSRAANADHLRDLAQVAGVRDNQLVGYGIVTGLAGTGDDVTAPFAQQSVLNLLKNLGTTVDTKQIQLKNVAAVVVTATIPAFAKSGTKLDVQVSSIGNAKSISSGVLIQTKLLGADQKTYAVAQGSVLTGGVSASGSSGSSVKTGSTTAGRIPEGALVEKEIPTTFVTDNQIKLTLRTPSFTVASRMTTAIDKQLGEGTASAPDGGSVVVKVPDKYKTKPVELLALLEDVEVTPVRKAKVVVSERTQTIVAGGDVRISPAVVVHGGLTIVVKEQAAVSQPAAPLTTGKTAVVQQSDVTTKEKGPENSVKLMPGAATLADVASALGTLGLTPRELASVLEALRTAGALEAEVVVE
ncbi:MAG: flagellar basal body P-ring protein FlgI [Polyangiaceae bacterium]